MNDAYLPIIDALNALSEAVKAAIPSNSPVSILQGNWAFPGITRSELMLAATGLAERVATITVNPTKDSLSSITGLAERIEFLTVNTIPHLTSQSAAIPVYLTTLDSVERAMRNVLLDSKAMAHRESLALKRSGAQIRGMENRIKDLDSRTVGLDEMVQAIERAHEAADQLPTDLDTLAESQKRSRHCFQSQNEIVRTLKLHANLSKLWTSYWRINQ